MCSLPLDHRVTRRPAVRLFIAVFVLVMSFVGRQNSAAEEGSKTVAQAAKQIDAKVGQLERAIDSDDRTMEGVASESLSREIEILQDKTIMIFGERKRRWDAANKRLGIALTEFASASEGANETLSRQSLAELRTAWTAMQLEYPEEALEPLPLLWTCPMHSEVIEREAVSCPICNMSLEPIYVTQPELTIEPLIRAEMVSAAQLEVGKKASLRIRLVFNKDGTPVRLEDLEVAHTRKIHLLIVDLSETDYHHEHPEPTGDGEYSFSFIPTRPGPYRVWADLKPVRTQFQQYSIADLPAATEGQLPTEEMENSEAEAGGYKFRLSFDKAVLEAKSTVLGTLHVTGPDGEPCRKLEVVMGAFGHFVGFCEDYSTVLHIHPVGPELDDLPDTRGGPDLHFYFRSNQPGLIRLFTQVQLDGKNLFPRFIVKVQPRKLAAQ